MILARDASLQVLTDEALEERRDACDRFDQAHGWISIPLENAGAAVRSGARNRTVDLSTGSKRMLRGGRSEGEDRILATLECNYGTGCQYSMYASSW